MSVITWVKKNKLTFVLLLIVFYFVFRNFFGANLLRMQSKTSVSQYGDVVSPGIGGSFGAPAPEVSRIGLPDIYPPQPDYAPQPGITDRLVIQESSVSLLVENVVDTRNKILEFTNSSGGYMVNVSTSNPQDAPTASVVIRIPAGKLQEALDYFHSLSIKVVSENLVGRDVTDQYIDIEKRIETYENTKARFESILDQATEIDDITRLTREIINMQTQIDSLRGQQESLEQNAALAKLTIYLSTDEIALPYAPSETFRPNVIFKLAVRSVVRTLRGIATYAIWVGVYSVIWIPVIGIYLLIKKLLRSRRTKNPSDKI